MRDKWGNSVIPIKRISKGKYTYTDPAGKVLIMEHHPEDHGYWWCGTAEVPDREKYTALWQIRRAYAPSDPVVTPTGSLRTVSIILYRDRGVVIYTTDKYKRRECECSYTEAMSMISVLQNSRYKWDMRASVGELTGNVIINTRKEH